MNFKDCRKVCKEQKKCEWFTYYEETKYCNLYHGCTCNKLGECRESSRVGVSFPQNVEDCRKDCKEHTNCQWFTYYEEAKFCNLFDSCTEFTTDCLQCVSGEVPCPEVLTMTVTTTTTTTATTTTTSTMPKIQIINCYKAKYFKKQHFSLSFLPMYF